MRSWSRRSIEEVIKAVYRPIRSKHISGKVFEFTNTNRFKNADYLKVIWTQYLNGIEKKTGELSLDIEPMQTKTYEIPFVECDSSQDSHINIAYFDGDDQMAIEQITINDTANFLPEFNGVGKVEVKEANNNVTVEFESGRVVFDKKKVFSSVSKLIFLS